MLYESCQFFSWFCCCVGVVQARRSQETKAFWSWITKMMMDSFEHKGKTLWNWKVLRKTILSWDGKKGNRTQRERERDTAHTNAPSIKVNSKMSRPFRGENELGMENVMWRWMLTSVGSVWGNCSECLEWFRMSDAQVGFCSYNHTVEKISALTMIRWTIAIDVAHGSKINCCRHLRSFTPAASIFFYLCRVVFIRFIVAMEWNCKSISIRITFLQWQ